MYFNKIAITALVIFSICASFTIGLLGQDIYKEFKEEQRLSKMPRDESERVSEECRKYLVNASTSLSITENQEMEYKKVLAVRECEAERIRAELIKSKTTR